MRLKKRQYHGFLIKETLNRWNFRISLHLCMMYDAYQKLLGPDAKELLEQAGCDDAAYPWSDAPVETIEAIVEVVQLPDEP